MSIDGWAEQGRRASRVRVGTVTTEKWRESAPLPYMPLIMQSITGPLGPCASLVGCRLTWATWHKCRMIFITTHDPSADPPKAEKIGYSAKRWTPRRSQRIRLFMFSTIIPPSQQPHCRPLLKGIKEIKADMQPLKKAKQNRKPIETPYIKVLLKYFGQLQKFEWAPARPTVRTRQRSKITTKERATHRDREGDTDREGASQKKHAGHR